MKKILSLFAICAMAVTSASASTDPDYVEIGGLRWATMNLGATTVAGTTTNPETAFGDYYSWGATSTIVSSIPWSSWTKWGTGLTLTFIDGKSDGYTQANDPLWNGSAWTYSPATGTTRSEGFDSHDAAKTVLGGNWRMPSADEFKALADACGSATTYSGGDITEGGIYWISPTKGSSVTIDGVAYSVPGNLFVSSADVTKRVFFPAAGYMGFNNNGTTLRSAGSLGEYWSSSLYDADKAYMLSFSEVTIFFAPQNKFPRYYGQSVRAVQDIPTSTAVTLSENDDITAMCEWDESKTYDITLNRTMKANRWNTLMLSFPMTAAEVKSNFGSDVTLMKMTGIADNVVSFETVDLATDDATAIDVCEAYIVKPTAAIEQIKVTGKTGLKNDIYEGDYKLSVKDGYGRKVFGDWTVRSSFYSGIVKSTSIYDEYVLSNDKFYYADEEKDILGYRWLLYTNKSSAARALTLSLDGQTTGISNLNADVNANKANGKFIQNGRMVIVNNNKKFNVNGQEVK